MANTTNPTGSDLWPELPTPEPQVDELREQIEPLLLSWNTIYGIELDTNQKHALLYEVIPNILTLITTKRAEWERAIGERWFQYLINEVGYEKARQYKDIEAFEEGK